MSKGKGEEEIFETSDKKSHPDSDEGPQLSVYQQQLVNRDAPIYGEDKIIDARLNPEQAFQVFNGSIFTAPKVDYYSLADTIERRAEAPMQRYMRLRAELDELQTDLDNMVIDEEGAADGSDGAATQKKAKPQGSSSIWSLLQAQTAHLKQTAAKLESHKAFRAQDPAAKEKELAAAVESLSLNSNESANAGGINSTTARGASGSGEVESNELLYALEKRIYHLETLLGSLSNYNDIVQSVGKLSHSVGHKHSTMPTSTPFPLLETIAKLEARVALLSPAEIETIRAKCNTLKMDLENTMKSKAAAAAESRAIEAVKTLSDLLEKIEKVESIAGDLPALVLRLKTLEHVHVAASTFNTRLQQLENDVKDIAGDLSSNRDVLATLKQNLQENLATVQANIATVNKKLEK